VTTDDMMKDLTDVPRGNPEWAWDNPLEAGREFIRQHPEFVHRATRMAIQRERLDGERDALALRLAA